MVGVLNSTESTGRHGQRSLTIKAEEVGAEMKAYYDREDLGASLGRFELPTIAKFDGEGGMLWLRQFGTGNRDAGRAIAVDGNGHVLASGRTPRPCS